MGRCVLLISTSKLISIYMLNFIHLILPISNSNGIRENRCYMKIYTKN